MADAKNDVDLIDRLTRGDLAAKIRTAGLHMVSRPLAEREFDLARAVIHTLEEQDCILREISPSGADGAKISQSNPYIRHDVFHEKINDKYSHIAECRINIRPNILDYIVRSYPLFLYTSHIVERYEKRTKGGVLDYADDEFTRLLTISLCLSKAAETYLDNLGAKRAKMVIPVQDGLFLGSCEKADPDIIDRGNQIFAERPPTGRGKILNKTRQWRPTVGLVMNSYVHISKLSGDHKQIYNSFREIFNDKAGYVGGNIYLNYFAGELLDKIAHAQVVQEAATKIGDLEVRMTAPTLPQGSKQVNWGPEEARLMCAATKSDYDSFMTDLGNFFEQDLWQRYNLKPLTHESSFRLNL